MPSINVPAAVRVVGQINTSSLKINNFRSVSIWTYVTL